MLKKKQLTKEVFMIKALGAYLRKCPHRIITLCLMLMTLSGIGANYLVIFVNGAKMPVAIREEDILLRMTSDKFAEKMLPLIEKEALSESYFDAEHAALTTHTKLPLLGDRILVYISGTAPIFLPEWTNYFLRNTWFPRYDLGGLISIGDMLQWTGITLLVFWVIVISLQKLCVSAYRSPSK